MKLIFAVVLWLSNKIIVIFSLFALLTILFTASDTLSPLGQNLWEQLLGKDQQEIVDRLNDDINKLNADIREIERVTTPQIKLDLDREKENLRLRIIEECETEVPWYEFYRFDKHLLKDQQKPACEALKNSQAFSQRLDEEYFKRIKQIENLKKNLGQKLLQLRDVEQKLGGVWKLLAVNFQKNWTYISYIIFLVLFASPLWKILWFYGIAPFAEKSPPIQLTDPISNGNIIYKEAEKTVCVVVDSYNPLNVRMDYMNQYDRNLIKRTRLFWRWSAPFISYAAGLFELTEFTTRNTVDDGNVVLSPKTVSNYITEIELQQHHGLVIRPACIVGISGDMQVRTQWVWSFHSWLTGQHRYIIFYGTGKLYLEGSGGIYVMKSSPAKTSIESHLLIGFDSRLGYSTIRTETFWPYFRNKVSLIDNQFSGQGVFLRQAVASAKALTPVERNFQFVGNLTSIVGKFFGF